MKSKGFTLVEILIAISIVMILTAIAIPVYRVAKEASSRTVCTSNLRQVHQAIMMYEDDHEAPPLSLRELVNYVPMVRQVLICPKDGSKGTELPNSGGLRGNPNSYIFVPTSYEMIYIAEYVVTLGRGTQLPSAERIVASCRWHGRNNAQDDIMAHSIFADGHIGWVNTSDPIPWYEDWKDSKP